MKKIFLPTQRNMLFKACILFILIALLGKSLKAQFLVIGTSTTNTNGSNPDPIDRFGNYMHYQIVYLATELSAGGMTAGSQITALGFSVSESPSALANFTISMGHTSQALANPYISSGLSNVKSPFTYTPTAQPASSFDMIIFDTPFTWNGVSNIVVNTCTGSNAISTPYGGLRYSSSASGIARYIRSNLPTNCATATNTNSPNRPNIRFNYSNSPCSGVPTPGNTLTSANPVCINQLFTLSLQNINVGSGLTYQWYKNWIAIAGATNSTYTTSITTNSNFYCEVNCSGNIQSSNPVSISLNNFLNCYCTSQASTNFDEEIYNVIVNGDATNPLYSNLNACTTVAPGPGSLLGRYSNFKTLGSLTHFAAGASIPFTIFENECDGPQYMSFGTSIWIDYNQNGSFADAGEQVFVETSTLMGPRNITGIITVPTTVITGCTAMRITVAENTSGSALTPCLSYAYGETEDYMICIDSACQGTPNVGVITPQYNNPCDSNASIILTINGNNNVTGIGYQWEVSNTPTGPWVTIAGSTSQTYTIPSPSIPSYYNCIATCSTSMLSSMAAPIIIQPYPLTIELDTVYCNGQNTQGQHLYHYVLHFNNATYGNAVIASITSLDGTIVSVSSTTVLPGMNVISGDLLIGSSVLTKYGFFCL